MGKDGRTNLIKESIEPGQCRVRCTMLYHYTIFYPTIIPIVSPTGGQPRLLQAAELNVGNFARAVFVQHSEDGCLKAQETWAMMGHEKNEQIIDLHCFTNEP